MRILAFKAHLKLNKPLAAGDLSGYETEDGFQKLDGELTKWDNTGKPVMFSISPGRRMKSGGPGQKNVRIKRIS